MKVSITGGSGFVGTNYVKYIIANFPQSNIVIFDENEPPLQNTPQVRFINGSILDKSSLECALDKSDIVIHLAAEIGTSETFINPLKTAETNIIGTLNVLDYARKSGCILLFISKPNVWINPYSITKDCAEQFVKMYVEEFLVRAITVKFFSVYGPYQHLTKHNKAVPSFIFNALQDKDVTLFGDGLQEADFIYIDDAIKASWIAIDRKLFGNTIEIGTGKGISAKSLAESIISKSNSSSNIIYKPMRIGESKDAKIVANTEKMRRLLDYDCTTSIDKGINKTINFYKDKNNFLFFSKK